MCFGCSKEPSHWDGSSVYPEHMFWLRNTKKTFSYTLLSWGLFLSENILAFCSGISNKFSPCDKDVWRSSLRSAMCAASQLPGREPTDVDDAPASAC